MIYLDSNIFIFALLYDEESMQEAKLARIALEDVIKLKTDACSSSLTWDEVVYVVRKKAGIQESIQVGDNLLKFPNLHLIPTNREILLLAQELIKQYSIRPRDAIHAASAIRSGCTSILSEDSDFDKIDSIQRVSLVEYDHRR